MTKIVFFNILMNLVFTIVFVLLNQWAYRQQLEETFVAFAVLFGVTVLVGNALYVSFSAKVSSA